MGTTKQNTFRKMLSLVREYHTEFTEDVSPELLLAIFWEESKFSNVPQKGGGPAVGYGQVEKQTLWLINQFFSTELMIPMNWNAAEVLGSDEKAVRVSPRAIHMLRWKDLKTGKRRTSPDTQDAALKRYGGVGEANAGLSTSTQLGIIAGWKACERKLREMAGNYTDGRRLREALSLARASNDAAFLTTFPLMKTAFYLAWAKNPWIQADHRTLMTELALLGAARADDISIHTSCVVAFGPDARAPGDPVETGLEKAKQMGVPIVSAADLASRVGATLSPVAGQVPTDPRGAQFLAKLPPSL
jgi:hypothetical protein